MGSNDTGTKIFVQALFCGSNSILSIVKQKRNNFPITQYEDIVKTEMKFKKVFCNMASQKVIGQVGPNERVDFY